MKLLRIICLLSALAMLLCACDPNGGEGVVTTAPVTDAPATPNVGTTEGQQPELDVPTGVDSSIGSFAIVYPAGARTTVRDAAEALAAAIREKTGVTLTVSTGTTEAACEILIGETDREESAVVGTTLEVGDYAVQTVVTDTELKLVLLGSNENMTLKAVERFTELLNGDRAVNAEGKLVTQSLMENYYDAYKDFRVELGEAITVYQAPEADTHWGHYQFPSISYTASGAIRVSWSYSNDSIYDNTNHGIPNPVRYATSFDGGLTWQPGVNDAGTNYDDAKVLMSNGRYFTGFSGRTGAFEMDPNVLGKYTPMMSGVMGNTIDVYNAEDVKEYKFRLTGSERDPKTGAVYSFTAKVNWPYMPLNAYHSYQTGVKSYINPVEGYFGLQNYMGMISTEDGLYFALYTVGVDSKTGIAGRYHQYYSVYVFHSEDCGRTWNYVSQISMTRKLFNEAIGSGTTCEGFDEPTITQAPDGSIVMILRTGSNNPSYIVRSTDGCKTWSEPEKFDVCGVLPQLMTLGCGVTIASYGRPDLYVRATSDPSCLEWEDHINVPLANGSGGSASCYYTRLLRIDDTSAWVVYSDFTTPNADGEPRKSIIVRKITIVPNE